MLTEGNITKKLLLFSLPILLGRLLQIFYNIADTRIISFYLGSAPLSAVGSVSSMYHLLTGLVDGFALGFSLIIALYVGSGDRRQVESTFRHSFRLGMALSVFLAVVISLSYPWLLRLWNVPQAEWGMAYHYILILTIGLPITMCYDLFANALRAKGNPTVPLVFLSVSTVLNIGMDLLFVAILGFGVTGAAVATVTAQGIAALACFLYVYRKEPDFRVGNSITWNRSLVAELMKNGVSMGLMSCVVNIGTVTLQTSINAMGTQIIVAHVAARRVFEILSVPFGALGTAIATFTSQNIGAKNYLRVRKGLFTALKISAVWCVVVLFIIYVGASHYIQFLTSSKDETVVLWGSRYLWINMSALYLCAIVVLCRNALQGMGNRIIPVVSSGVELGTKIVFAAISAMFFGYWGVIWTEPVAWFLMAIPLMVRLAKFFRSPEFCEKA